MILIGQYDSPFVRRVGVALKLYDLPFEHRPWSVFGDAEKVAFYNPLRRVPTLVLDTGEVLIESAAILDYLDEQVEPDDAMMAEYGPERRRALKVCALATGMADKAVSLVYERVLRPETSKVWVERCKTQIGDVLDALELDRSNRPSPWWFGDRIGHADIAVACALNFLNESHPGLLGDKSWPRLAALSAECEALSVFKEIYQAVSPPSA
ncbi:glutathione S-transferase family protein [Kaistia dalseonensis]|uniref:Glutathione S-transferase n=1 Tax=Kaistia dalseonensis TaxID=410840 RepID=A0ABU0H3G0_9HYPH|nr:glutathione S-transferase family protein [Kaistia dalseonensis]MCX5494250.1 glutathione S-transferase family protein [Kaistia dalseonensis]MDQ0436830.1 glutathione S-transferase [Kaistia dalseonensis]